VSAFTIRLATREDSSIVLALIGELAAYENAADRVRIDEDRLARYVFAERPLVDVFLALEGNDPVGYAMVFPIFSSYQGLPILFLEDLYLREAARAKGYGRRFMSFLARLALTRGCRSLTWGVLEWNQPSIDFYRRLGAERELGHEYYSLSGPLLDSLARWDGELTRPV
jgi:GNAT superfamily N-acetyltransferase